MAHARVIGCAWGVCIHACMHLVLIPAILRIKHCMRPAVGALVRPVKPRLSMHTGPPRMHARTAECCTSPQHYTGITACAPLWALVRPENPSASVSRLSAPMCAEERRSEPMKMRYRSRLAGVEMGACG